MNVKAIVPYFYENPETNYFAAHHWADNPVTAGSWISVHEEKRGVWLKGKDWLLRGSGARRGLWDGDFWRWRLGCYGLQAGLGYGMAWRPGPKVIYYRHQARWGVNIASSGVEMGNPG